MNVPREAKVPVHTAEESVLELSIVTQSKGTPRASATIWVWTVFEPWPMSTVPAKTSTRPSGLSLIQAWLGSPFWFMPVGYSMVEKPRPWCLAIRKDLLHHRGRARPREPAGLPDARAADPRCGDRPSSAC